MKKLALVVSAAAVLAIPTASAQAAGGIPEINCGIVSCTYQIEQAVESAQEETTGVRDCVNAAVTAIRYILQGTPQPQACSI